MKLFKTNQFPSDIHSKFYQDEFELPNSHEFISIDSILDDNNSPIVTGGIRPIYELILVTDKSKSVLERKQAFDLLLARLISYNLDLHVFIQDSKWKNRVIKSFGFIPTKGEALVLKVR